MGPRASAQVPTLAVTSVLPLLAFPTSCLPWVLPQLTPVPSWPHGLYPGPHGCMDQRGPPCPGCAVLGRWGGQASTQLTMWRDVVSYRNDHILHLRLSNIPVQLLPPRGGVYFPSLESGLVCWKTTHTPPNTVSPFIPDKAQTWLSPAKICKASLQLTGYMTSPAETTRTTC